MVRIGTRGIVSLPDREVEVGAMDRAKPLPSTAARTARSRYTSTSATAPPDDCAAAREAYTSRKRLIGRKREDRCASAAASAFFGDAIALVAFDLLAMDRAVARDYPARPVTLIVPYPAGGGGRTTRRA